NALYATVCNINIAGRSNAQAKVTRPGDETIAPRDETISPFHEKLPKRPTSILIRNEDVGRRTRGAYFKGTSMTFTGSLFRGSKLVAATALTLGLLTTASFAYTQEQQQLCTGDAMRLCSSEIPDVDRVTACMIAKQAQLSDGCKS